MNIVFFTRFFYPHVGGVEKHVYKICQELKKKHTIVVVTEQYDLRLPLVDYVDDIVIYRIPQFKESKEKKYNIWNYLFENRNIFRSADIVHIHDVFYWYFPFRLIYPSKPVYMTFHGYEGNSLPTVKAKISHKIAEILTNGNICIGDYLKKWYRTTPTLVSYGAIDRNTTLEPSSISKKDRYKILYIGRLEEEAGIMEYLQMTHKLIKKGYNIHLTVLGDGSLLRKAETYMKKHHLPVRFLGFVPEVEKYIPKYDIVFTSRFLGTMEALSFKKPVFCVYNNAIKRDCFTMAPFAKHIFLSDSAYTLVDSFEQMVQNRELTHTKIRNGYEWVRRETWKKMAHNYELLWRR